MYTTPDPNATKAPMSWTMGTDSSWKEKSAQWLASTLCTVVGINAMSHEKMVATLCWAHTSSGKHLLLPTVYTGEMKENEERVAQIGKLTISKAMRSNSFPVFTSILVLFSSWSITN